MAIFTIHGARGSAPASGRAFNRHGSATSCFSLAARHGLIVLDAGTGIMALGEHLARKTHIPPITMLFTHMHLDHVAGMPLFKPFYRRDAYIKIMTPKLLKEKWDQNLARLFAPPFWPIALPDCGAKIKFQTLPEHPFKINGITIRHTRLWHAQTCLAYRLEAGAYAIVIATDHEPGQAETDRRLEKFCGNANLVVADAHYTPREFKKRRGWGHGTWRHCALLAQASGARELILTHHDPRRTDRQIDALTELSRRIFPNTNAAYAGLSRKFKAL